MPWKDAEDLFRSEKSGAPEVSDFIFTSVNTLRS
jgi:hypothetical protein